MKNEEAKPIEETQETTKITPTGDCGSMPTRPGSKNPGDWDCQNGTWVWVENIGG